MTGKIKALQEWCQKNTSGYGNVNIVDMTTSWRDGLAFCALIHRFRPDLIDFNSLHKDNYLHNVELAFQIAENELEITAFLDAEDIVSTSVPDILSIITYVSLYYNCFKDVKPVVRDEKKNTKLQLKDIPAIQHVYDLEKATKPEEDKSLKHVKSQKGIQVPDETKRKALSKTKASTPAEKQPVTSTCGICEKNVHLVERYLDNGKVCHRLCHRTKCLDELNQIDISSFAVENKSDKMESSQSKNNHADIPEADSDHSPRKPLNDVSINQVSSVSVNNTKEDSVESETLKVISNLAVDTALSDNLPDCTENSKVANDTKSEESIPNVVSADITEDKCHEPPENNAEAVDNEKTNPFSETSSMSETSLDNSDARSNTSETANITSEKTEDQSESVNQDVVQEDIDTKEMFPSLLESLADGKQRRLSGGSESAESDKHDKSPSVATAPLISELPKAPEARPRSRISSSDPLSNDKPKAKPRLKVLSTDSGSSKRKSDEEAVGSGDDYDSRLNPFSMSDSESESSATQDADGNKSYDDSLNPFGDDFSDSQSVEDDDREAASTDKVVKSLNPFEDDSGEEEAAQEPISKVVASETLNTTSQVDNRLNPFSEEYERKKKAPPPPPSRKKAPAPLPPQKERGGTNQHRSSHDKSYSQKSDSSPIKTSVVSGKRAAPNWKENVEQKMAEMNKLNATDQKYVEKAQNKAVNQPNSPDRSGSIKSRGSAQSTKSKSPLHKPTRTAPGFGFPLVKRDVKNTLKDSDMKREMDKVGVQLKHIEERGVKLEEELRNEIKQVVADLSEEIDGKLREWCDLVREKNKLVRRENELVFIMTQQRLEQEYADLEFKLRKLLNKPDSEKCDKDEKDESELLEKLMANVERRNTHINSIEETRVREGREDAAIDTMKMMQVDSTNGAAEGVKKKRKIKVKKIFTKKKKGEKSATKLEASSTPEKTS